VEFDAPLGDDDKTPPPTPNPFALDGDEALAAPLDEPKVQVAADLQEEMEATQSRATALSRSSRPTPPARPAASLPQRPAPQPVRRPLAPRLPPPPVPDEDLVDDASQDNSEKTAIRAMPEKPRR
jgi:pilus assembly protein CpaF